MTSISEHKRVWRLAGPIIIANLSVPLLGAVDTAVMGHLPQSYYLGAVAVATVIFHFLYWSFGFLRMGTTGLTAQAYGANDKGEIYAVFVRALGLGCVIGVGLWIFQWPILQGALFVFDASDKVENLAEIYFNIRIWSAPAVLANYCLVGWFIGMHNTRAALIVQVWMNGLNIALDLLFVFSLGWGVAGVAAATVISEVSAVFLGLYLFRRQIMQMAITVGSTSILDAPKIKRMFSINSDIFVRTFCLIFAFSFFTAQAAKLGDDTLAANAVLIQFQHFLSFGLDGFAHAAEALVGGAMGAKNKSSFRSAVVTASQWAIFVALLYALVYWIAGSYIIDLITNIEHVRATAREFLVWLVILPIISVWSFMLDGIFIGATKTKEMRNAMILSLAVFLIAVFLLKAPFGNHGLWMALTIFMVARAITLGVLYPRIERSVGQLETDAVSKAE